MFTTYETRATVSHPLLLLVLVTLLGMLAASFIAASDGAPRSAPPALLPSAGPAARPLQLTPVDELWQALAAHQAGDFEGAVRHWQHVSLSEDREVWRQVALAAAFLESAALDHAEAALHAALESDPENGAVYFLAGRLSAQRAQDARQYHDAVLDPGTRLVQYGAKPSPGSAPSKPRERYELEAAHYFELAVRWADHVAPQQPLVPVTWAVNVPYPAPLPAVPPTVQDLLQVLEADDFAGRAHRLLLELYLEHGHPERAEYHADRAVAAGRADYGVYQSVAEQYEMHGNELEAHRVFMKSMNGPANAVQPNERSSRRVAPSVSNAFRELD